MSNVKPLWTPPTQDDLLTKMECLRIANAFHSSENSSVATDGAGVLKTAQSMYDWITGAQKK